MAANFLGRSGVGPDLRPRNEREQLCVSFFAALEGASSGYYHSRVNQPISAPQAFLALRAILAVLDQNLFFRFRRVERKKSAPASRTHAIELIQLRPGVRILQPTWT